MVSLGSLPMLPPAGSRTIESRGGAQDRSPLSEGACLVEDVDVTQDSSARILCCDTIADHDMGRVQCIPPRCAVHLVRLHMQ